MYNMFNLYFREKGYINVWFYSDGIECLRFYIVIGVLLLLEVVKFLDVDV